LTILLARTQLSRYDSAIVKPFLYRSFGGLAIALILLFAAGTAGVASAWTVVTSPNPPIPTGSLTGISCPDNINCIAVGYLSGTSGYVTPFAEARSTTGWALETVPAPAGSTGAYLNGVACTTTTACTAVGYTINTDQTQSPLIERWNGSAWSIQNAPGAPGASFTQLWGVACSGANFCMAVGNYSNTSPDSNLNAIAESWDGSSWSIQTTQPQSTQLRAVSCFDAVHCVAVGTFVSTSAAAMQWNGSAWTSFGMPNLGGVSELSGVSCTTVRSCMAVGFVNSGSATGGVPLTLAEQWNGNKWRVLPTPNPSGTIGAFLAGVACGSGGCTAVGYNEPPSGLAPIVTLAESWNGGLWSIQPTSNPAGAINSLLLGVACPSQTSCVSAGYDAGMGTGPAGSPILTLAEVQRAGSWSVTSTTNPGGSLGAAFNGVSCTSAASCEAAGYTADASGNYVTLAEAWDGSTWTPQSTASPASQSSMFTAISCGSSLSCVAVGNYFDANSNSQMFAESFDGSAWSTAALVAPSGSVNAQLTSISCPAAAVCTAVGYYSTTGNDDLPLAESWDGTAWTIQAMPAPTDNLTTFLYSVSCVSSFACVAVGLNDSRTTSGPVAEIWDGTAWSLQFTAKPLGFNPSLSAVSCWSVNACQAVGGFNPGTGYDDPFAETWDGTTWIVQNMPTPTSTLPAAMNAISCTSASACTAVGSGSDSSLKDYTLAEIWDGTAWSITSTPSPPGQTAAFLKSVWCTTSCMALGRANGVTLVMAD
jgi:hypothetical protein